MSTTEFGYLLQFHYYCKQNTYFYYQKSPDMKKWTLPLVAMLLLLAFGIFKADRYEDTTMKKEKDAVKMAILDYVEGLYDVQPERIEKSVHKELRKRGYYFSKGAYQQADMTFEQLTQLAANWNKNGSNATDKSPKKIEIFDVLDKTATAKLTAEWGVDYFHLVKMDDKWVIMNVLWQSPPVTN